MLLRGEEPQRFLLGHSHGTDWVEYNAQGWLGHAKHNPAAQNAATLLQDSQKYEHGRTVIELADSVSPKHRSRQQMMPPQSDLCRVNCFAVAVLPQEEHQRAVHGPGQRCHRAVGLHRRPGRQLPAGTAASHQHEEDLHHRRGRRQEEESVYPDQTPSGEWLRSMIETADSFPSGSN